MKIELVENWATVAWRSAVTWTTLIVNAIVAAVGVHWAVLLGVLPFLPPLVRWPLAALIGARRPKVSAALTTLSESGLIEQAPDGTWTFFAADVDPMAVLAGIDDPSG